MHPEVGRGTDARTRRMRQTEQETRTDRATAWTEPGAAKGQPIFDPPATSYGARDLIPLGIAAAPSRKTSQRARSLPNSRRYA
jgi:hypothetical protein